MSQNRRLFGIAVVLSLVAIARADDWPQWHGPTRDNRVPAGAPIPSSLATVKVLWHLKAGFGLSSPVVAGGKVFHTDAQDGKETIHAVDATSGEAVWATQLGPVHSDNQSRPGPRCTPLVDGDRVYVQSTRGGLACLSATDGKVVWQVDYVKDFGAVYIGEKGTAQGASRHGYTGSPLIDGERLIAEVGGTHGASVVCFDKHDGKVLWKSQDDTPGYAAPVVANIGGTHQVVAFMAQRVIGLNTLDGALLWHSPVKTSLARHVTTPVVDADMVIVSSHQAGLIGIRVNKLGDAFTAEQAWASKESAINFSSPVTASGYLYGLGPAKNLVCVEMQSGRQTWSKDGYFPSSSGGNAHAALLVMGENLLVLTDTGELVLAAADPKAFREIGRAQVCGHTWCDPAYAGGKLFLRDDRELYAVQLVP